MRTGWKVQREHYLELQAGMANGEKVVSDREDTASTSKSSEGGTCVGLKHRVRIELVCKSCCIAKMFVIIT